MKLKDLLIKHDLTQPKGCLRDNLGDGYLIQKNPIYRAVRVGSKKSKFKFTSKRFYDYDSLPLTQLPTILSKKIIPYCDNVSALRAIEKKSPSTFSLNSIPPLRSNHLFHESAHAVAHTLLIKIFSNSKKPGLNGEREFALRVLLEESFANACESLANIYSLDEAHDEFLYKNSYIMENALVRAQLKKAIHDFGLEPIFKLVILSFLHANFLRIRDVNENADRVAHFLFPAKKKPILVLRSIFKSGLSLDPEFTFFTNQFCLRLLGIPTDLKSLFNFDFLIKFEHSSPFKTALSQMGSFISESVKE